MDFVFYFTVLFFILLYGCLDTSIDFDFFSRLIVGKSFYQTGTLFNFDFQSFGATHKFIDHEWGSSLVFYLIQNYLGDIGLFVFKSLMIFLAIYLIVKIIRLQDEKIKLYFLPFFFALQAVSYSAFATVRCQTFSFVFYLFYLYILKYVQKTKNYRILWVLPVINIIWANLHGGFTIGLVLIFLFILGEALNKNKIKPYIISFIACLLTSLINPYGIEYITFIIGALKLNRIYVSEWQSAFFAKEFIFKFVKFKAFFFMTIPLFIFGLAKNIKLDGFKNYYQKLDKTKFLILLFTTLIAVKSLRFHVFFVYSVMALCYSDFYNIFNKKLPKIIDNAKEIILLILITISMIYHLIDYGFLNTVRPVNYPIYCVEFVKKNNLAGNLLVNFHMAGYASWKLYPQNHIYMDGRYEEVYDVNLINAMAHTYLGRDNGEFLRKNHVDIIILENIFDLFYILQNPDSGWFLAYSDNMYGVFLPIKYRFMNFKAPTSSLEYYNRSKYDTNIDWFK